MADTLADLWREVGLEPSAVQTAIAPARPPLRPQRQPFGVRPMPRQMRRPEVRAADPRLAPAERTRAYNQVQRTQNPQLRGERLPPGNQFAEAGEMLWEGTGVPAAGRSGQALHEGRYGDAAWEGGASLLALGSLALPLPRGGGPRVAPRLMAEAPPAIRPPPRLPGRASDGSVLPVRPSEPFRNSLRGGSDDLMEAARPTSDAVQPNDGFDIPLLHGTTADTSGNILPSSTAPDLARGRHASGAHTLGPGGYFAHMRNPETADFYARGGNRGVGAEYPDGANVVPTMARGPLATGRQYTNAMDAAIAKTRGDVRRAREIAQADLERQGFTGVDDEATGFVNIFNPERDTRPRFGSPRPTPSDATRGGVERVSPRNNFGYDEMVSEPLAGLRGGGDWRTWRREAERRSLLENGGELEEVPLANLTPVQDRVNPNWQTVTGAEGDPVVVYLRGNYYLADGHHRAARALARGETNLRARVYYPDGRPAQSDGSNPRPPPDLNKSHPSTRKPLFGAAFSSRGW